MHISVPRPDCRHPFTSQKKKVKEREREGKLKKIESKNEKKKKEKTVQLIRKNHATPAQANLDLTDVAQKLFKTISPILSLLHPSIFPQTPFFQTQALNANAPQFIYLFTFLTNYLSISVFFFSIPLTSNQQHPNEV